MQPWVKYFCSIPCMVSKVGRRHRTRRSSFPCLRTPCSFYFRYHACNAVKMFLAMMSCGTNVLQASASLGWSVGWSTAVISRYPLVLSPPQPNILRWKNKKNTYASFCLRRAHDPVMETSLFETHVFPSWQMPHPLKKCLVF